MPIKAKKKFEIYIFILQIEASSFINISSDFFLGRTMDVGGEAKKDKIFWPWIVTFNPRVSANAGYVNGARKDVKS